MTIKEAFENYDWWHADCTEAQKQQAVTFWQNNLPDQKIREHPTGLSTVTIQVETLTLHVGMGNNTGLVRIISVPYNQLVTAVQKLLSVRHELPLNGNKKSSRKSVGLYVFADRVYLPQLGYVTAADWANVVGVSFPNTDEEL